ncbi:MAG: hypothetical protein RBU37_03075 [Myxococcota bacterium]|jgi:hypothetical protein|nr:hypothetical protein [Myxococcota bacterium]
MYRFLFVLLLLPLSACSFQCGHDLFKKDFAIERAEFEIADKGDRSRVDFDVKVVGVSTKKSGSEYNVDMLIEMKAQMPDGSELPLPPETTNEFKNSGKDPIDFVTFTPYLEFPKSMPRGEYTVEFHITDRIADKKASKTLKVTLE